MPNHCFNSLTVSENQQEVFDFIRGEKSVFDFNKVIQMPEILLHADFLSAKAKKGLVEKHGYDHWYPWRLDNWDTKWNAYDAEVCDNGILFLTAWSPPYNIIVALSKKFPNVEFELSFDIEGDSESNDTIRYKNGIEVG